MPKTFLLKQEGTMRRIESMQQSSATLKNQNVGIGLRKIVICSQSCLLVSTVFGIVSSLHPTSIKIIKNEVGCRDDTVPKTVDTRRHCEEE